MLESIRTLLLAAAGAVELTDEKIRGIVDDLVRRGEMAADEALDWTSRLAARASARDERTDARIRAAVEEALARQNAASHASVLELQARVAALEDAIAQIATPAAAS
jgi:polyhydroxyalkanoate synthesis regulator phasin